MKNKSNFQVKCDVSIIKEKWIH